MKMRDSVPPEVAFVEAADAPTFGTGINCRRTLRIPNHRPATIAFAIFMAAVIALLSACNNDTPKPAETKPELKPPELLTGRSAFYKTFIAARNYAADVKPFRIESIPSSDGNGLDGKSAIWRSSFASATQHGVKPYFWSGSNAADAPSRGISPGNEDVYNPTNSSTEVFDPAFLKIDSDQAFTEAQKHGGGKLLEKDPATLVLYICDWNHNTNELTWHVVYGSSRETAKLTVAVNASTGAFIRVEK